MREAKVDCSLRAGANGSNAGGFGWSISTGVGCLNASKGLGFSLDAVSYDEEKAWSASFSNGFLATAGSTAVDGSNAVAVKGNTKAAAVLRGMSLCTSVVGASGAMVECTLVGSKRSSAGFKGESNGAGSTGCCKSFGCFSSIAEAEQGLCRLCGGSTGPGSREGVRAEVKVEAEDQV